jgi:sec-independent protein translocase protein TatA
MPFNIGPGEVILVLIILLVVVGPGKLPEIGSAFGRTLKEFRKATSEIQDTASVASGASVPNRMTGPQSTPNVLASESEPELVDAARDVTPRGTPADPVDEA